MRGAGGRLIGVALLACLASACVPLRGGWDVDALAGVVPEASGARHRLGDLAPHFAHRQGMLVLFLCRWSTDASIPVALPEDADADERAMLRLALDAWADADLGVRFEEDGTGAPAITIRFVEVGDPGPQPAGAGDTIADCEVGDLAAERLGRIDAQLRSASILLRRDQPDLLGRPVAIAPDERLGAAVHEIGHALGFSSHVATGASIMRASPEIARHVGAAVRRGDWGGDPNLAALYAVPSGVVVGRLALAVEQAGTAARFEAAARDAGLEGPWTRVGDRGARLFYRAPGRAPVALRVRPWPASTPADGGVELVPNAAARRLLEGPAVGRGGPIAISRVPD